MRTLTIFIIYTIAVIAIACQSNKEGKERIVIDSTKFFDGKGNVAIMPKIKIWQQDSLFIEQIYIIKTVTDEHKKTTVTYVPKFCRYINLQTQCYYDYYSFSDTSRCFRKAALPDSFFNDGGVAFYSDRQGEMMGTPKLLHDTIIEAQSYKRVKFFDKGLDSSKSYSIGLFPEGVPFSIFSMEKKFSRQQNWFMAKIYDYNKRNNMLYALREVETLATELSDKERNVFDAWEKFELNNPVKK